MRFSEPARSPVRPGRGLPSRATTSIASDSTTDSVRILSNLGYRENGQALMSNALQKPLTRRRSDPTISVARRKRPGSAGGASGSNAASRSGRQPRRTQTPYQSIGSA